MVFANDCDGAPSIFDIVNKALCIRSSSSISKIRNLLLGVVPAMRSLPRLDQNTLYIPVKKRFSEDSSVLTPGARLRCRSFVWACKEQETAQRLLQGAGTVFCVNAPSKKKKVSGYDLGDLVFPPRQNQVLMNPDLRVSVQFVELSTSSSSEHPFDIVHVVVDDSVLPLLEYRFPTRSAKELFDAAMALKAKKPLRDEERDLVVSLLKQAKSRGCVDAAFQLALCTYDGFGCVKNPDKAVVEITSAANNQCYDAMMWLGRYYKDGTPCKPKEALAWFDKAVALAGSNKDSEREQMAREEKSILESWRELDKQYRRDMDQKNRKKKGGYEDDEAFATIYRGALELAKKGFKNSMAIVGYLSMNGFGVPVNPGQAVRYLRAAADGGIANAIDNYAICLIQGFGCSQSWVQAVNWLFRASELGNVPAKVNLAHCALIGKARAYARDLLEYACSYEDPHGHLTAAICCYNGFGGYRKDNRETEQHLKFAKRNGSYHAEEAMDYWEHWIRRYYKREWLKVGALKWEICVPS